MTSVDIEIHERLVRLETVGKAQTDSITKLVDTIDNHCKADEKRSDEFASRLSSLEETLGNLTFGGKLLLRFIIGCIAVGGSIFAFVKWFHNVALK